jgi:putative ABC transport system substrate-binding protein
MKLYKRILITTLSFLLIFILAACGAEEKPVTIGILNLTPALDPVVDGLKEGMSELGYIEGENVIYIYDGPVGSIDGLEAAAQSLIDQDIDLMFAASTPAALTAQAITKGTDLPVIFAPINDPVASGLVDSLLQPGANLTGIKVGGFVPKELEWLMSVAPDSKRILAPYNPNDGSSVLGWEVLNETATVFDVEIVSPEVTSPEEVQAMLGDLPEDIDAIFMLTDSMILSQISAFSETALANNLPLASINRAQAEAGATITYGPEFFPVGKQSARLIDQILKGTNPAELPVETAEFFLTVNMKSANAINLEVPNNVLEVAHDILR